jgi:hypothetical protein
MDDTASVLLKDVIVTGLPSPYYRFEYDADKYVTEINFADGFNIYELEYSNKKLSKMTNSRIGNQLLYTYSSGNVSLITELTSFDQVVWKYRMAYNNNNQLTEIRWYQFNGGTDSILFRKVLLAYSSDGNLSSRDDYRLETGNVLAWSSNTKYLDYDNGINVDGFAVFKDFFESLIFLPAVKIQKNNHRTEIITGTQNDYRITYTYEYSNGLPVTENGTMIQTRGNGNGQPFLFTNHFSYY